MTKNNEDLFFDDREANFARLENLTELLGDSDECVASLAMEQLLNDGLWQGVVRRNMDCGDSMFRRRLHQLNNIGDRRRQREQLVGLLRAEKLKLWDGLMLLDQIYDNQSAESYLDELAEDLVRKFGEKKDASFEGLVRFMAEEKFSCMIKDWMEVGNYILGDTLESHRGSAIILCATAQYLARRRGTEVQIFLHHGHYCVSDGRRNMSAPIESWKLERNVDLDHYHPCRDHEILKVLMHRLFSVSIIEWIPWDIHFFSSLLEKVHGINRDKLPYPLGKVRLSGKKKT